MQVAATRRMQAARGASGERDASGKRGGKREMRRAGCERRANASGTHGASGELEAKRAGCELHADRQDARAKQEANSDPDVLRGPSRKGDAERERKA